MDTIGDRRCLCAFELAEEAEDDAAEQVKMVERPDDDPIAGHKLDLGVEKFRRPPKHYRLIWVYGDEAWLADQDETRYQRKTDVLVAGQQLADEFGARFSTVTR